MRCVSCWTKWKNIQSKKTMETILYYLLRSSICLLLFYGFFQLVVKESTFHHLNRVMLLSLLAASLLLPLFHFNGLIDWYQQEQSATGNYMIQYTTSAVSTKPAYVFPWVQTISLLYIFGILVVLLYYLAAWFQVEKIIRMCTMQLYPEDTLLYVTDKEIAPFTWMNKIVISKTDLDRNGEIIIRHEQAHVRLNHSFDLFLITVFSVLFWFNPFVWLFKWSLQQIHEFEADQQVLKDGIDAKQYKLVLIRRSAGEQTFAMASNFTYRSLQKRIQMMTKKKSNSLSRLTYWGVIPVALLATMLLSVPVVNAQKKEVTTQAASDSSKVTMNFHVVRTDSKSKAEPVVFKAKEGELLVVGSKSTENPQQIEVTVDDNIRTAVVVQSDTTVSSKQPLFFVDGKRVATIEGIDPNTIESVSVLKDKSATELYGKDAKDGVILVILKKEAK